MVEDNLTSRPLVGVSLNLDPNFIRCLLPFFESGKIQVLEWSFDTIVNQNGQPEWLNQLLLEYSKENRLLGHGVFYSLMDAKWTEKQESWIQQLAKTTKDYNYNHITEHFGFMSSGNFHKGCPLPVPLNKTTLAIGIDRLIRIQEVAKVPIGIENLAFAFSLDDVSRQGEFLEKLISPVNGFIILDLHNIYCQSHNFKMDFMQLIELYPLGSVREIHISGGSWEDEMYGTEKIRRDTHDGNIPQEIFEILTEVLQKCPFLEFVIFERLGNTCQTEKDILEYRKDFNRLIEIIDSSNIKLNRKVWGNTTQSSGPPLNDSVLYQQQQELSKQLVNANSLNDITVSLENWDISSWKPEMIETAIKMSKKWA